LIDALNGLHAAHELRDVEGNWLNLVHRDVSPQNFLVGIDGVTRIADFGIAKAESRATRTKTGQVKGKTGYMAPEQILGEPLDRRVDIYAAGVVLWEALVGKRLFLGDSDAEIINLVLGGKIPAPSAVSKASPNLDQIVGRALRFQAAERYATALEFAEALVGANVPVAAASIVGKSVEAFRRDQPQPAV
jgi:serine/threonine-protein kinase